MEIPLLKIVFLLINSSNFIILLLKEWKSYGMEDYIFLARNDGFFLYFYPFQEYDSLHQNNRIIIEISNAFRAP